jgi:hypothetical protein
VEGLKAKATLRGLLGRYVQASETVRLARLLCLQGARGGLSRALTMLAASHEALAVQGSADTVIGPANRQRDVSGVWLGDQKRVLCLFRARVLSIATQRNYWLVCL